MVKNKLVGMIFALSAGAAFAHGGATGIVKTRMDAMVDIAKEMKLLSAYFSGKTPYQADDVARAAGVISNHAGSNLITLFPQGSDKMVSEAAPRVWDDPDGFAKEADKLKLLAEALIAAAAGDPSDVADLPAEITAASLAQLPPATLFNGLGASCKSCHATYRIKK